MAGSRWSFCCDVSEEVWFAMVVTRSLSEWYSALILTDVRRTPSPDSGSSRAAPQASNPPSALTAAATTPAIASPGVGGAFLDAAGALPRGMPSAARSEAGRRLHGRCDVGAVVGSGFMRRQERVGEVVGARSRARHGSSLGDVLTLAGRPGLSLSLSLSLLCVLACLLAYLLACLRCLAWSGGS